MKISNVPTLKNFVSGVFFGIFIIAILVMTVGCSNQWTESDPEVDGAEVNALMAEFAQSGSMQMSFVDINELSSDPYATMYYAKSGSTMGPVPSIFSFSDVSFLGNTFGNLNYGMNVFDLQYNYGVSDVSVIFLDSFSQTLNDRVFTLMIKFEGQNGPAYFVAQSTEYVFEEDEFTAFFEVNGGTLALSTFDLDPDVEHELAGTISLKATMIDASGEYRIGKFSVLHGFGGFQ